MKHLIVASIVALGVAAPAVAQPTATLTLGQQVEVLLKSSEDSANDRATFFGNERINFSASNIHSDVAADIFARLKAESKEDE